VRKFFLGNVKYGSVPALRIRTTFRIPGVENELQVSYELKQAVGYIKPSNIQLCAAYSPWMADLFYSRKTMEIKSVPALNTLSTFQ
jgi:hypothetical protein